MHDWETRLTSVDNNRVVRPWNGAWSGLQAGRDGMALPAGKLRAIYRVFPRFNDRIIQNSDEFYSYRSPTDFRLEHREVQVFSTREVPDPKLEEKVRGTNAEFLRFTSPVATPYPENNLVNARWFPARGRRAVVVLPHWNADGSPITVCAECSIGWASPCFGQPALPRYQAAVRWFIARIMRFQRNRPHHRFGASRSDRRPFLSRLAGVARLQPARNRRHQPWLLLRIYRDIA